tara:strand:- start:400 stop:690 length:291 start_codon:yes stop_codon:yes gene_type:complete
MKYSNVVRFIPKEGELNTVLSILSKTDHLDGLLQNFIIQTGEKTCCAVGIWASEQHLINSREQMIEILDSIRDKLELISEDLGVTDPVSGPIIHET